MFMKFQYYKSTLQTAFGTQQLKQEGKDFNTTKVLFKLNVTLCNVYKTNQFQYYKSTLQTDYIEDCEACDMSFQYYKSTLQTCGRSNGGMSRCIISILQKYSSNAYRKLHAGVAGRDFNTTKVLFKQKNLSASSQGDKQFQYYKSTLQTRRKPAYLWYIHEYF